MAEFPELRSAKRRLQIISKCYKGKVSSQEVAQWVLPAVREVLASESGTDRHLQAAVETFALEIADSCYHDDHSSLLSDEAKQELGDIVLEELKAHSNSQIRNHVRNLHSCILPCKDDVVSSRGNLRAACAIIAAAPVMISNLHQHIKQEKPNSCHTSMVMENICGTLRQIVSNINDKLKRLVLNKTCSVSWNLQQLSLTYTSICACVLGEPSDGSVSLAPCILRVL